MKRYNFKLDLNGYTSHSKILQRVERGKKVLEIGVAQGQMTKYLREELDCTVVGIDICEEFLKSADEYLHRGICMNVDDLEKLDAQLENNEYDYIILGDVLEHCYNPLGILKTLHSKIKARGKIIISLPNIAHNVILMELLKDQYIYQEEGILDYTHIRNYTRSSFGVCLKELGYKIIDMDFTYTIPEQLQKEVRYEEQSVFTREVLINHMNGHVFQNIYVISKYEKDKDISNNISYISQENYDEITIDFDGKCKIYYINDKSANIKMILDSDYKQMSIKPSIRMRKYLMKIWVNGKLINKNAKEVVNNIYKINTENNKISISYAFKKDDNVEVEIDYINMPEKEVLTQMVELDAYRREGMKENISAEIKLIQDKIIESDIVSFDIFDTLLLRNVLEPTDIFKIVEHDYSKQTGEKIDFYKKRIEAECRARNKSKKEDVTLSEIYNQLKVGDRELLKKLEIETEKRFLIANQHIKPCFELAKQLGKKILIISDMYLPSELVKEILEEKGFVGYEELYVSCEINKTKATGSIYTYLREKLKISSTTKWVHVGDNEISDVKNACENNIEGIHYKKLNTREKEGVLASTLGDSIVKAIQINHKYVNNDKGYWYKFGQSTIASIYIGFTLWLANLLEGKDNAYFLARDGYIPYILYEKIRKYKSNLPEGRYIYASRRGYQYPHLTKIHKNEAVATLTAYNSALGQKLTLGEILKNIGLEQKSYVEKIGKFSIKSFDDVIEEGESLHNVRKFLCYIWEDIDKKLSKEREILEAYFKEIGMYNYDTVNVVDIGWRGSTQLAIKELLEKEVEGYYFGTLENMYGDIMSNSYGYAFDLGVPWENRNFILNNVMIYELIFSAPQKSLIKFKYNEHGEIEPVLKNVEKNDTIYTYIDEFQKGATSIFEKCIEYLEYIDISRGFALGSMERFINEKEISNLIEFQKLSNSVGFGNSEDIKQYVSQVTLQQYRKDTQKIIEKSAMNLWPYAIIIKDEYGRKFSNLEIDNMNAENNTTHALHTNRILTVARIKKAIKHPRKALFIGRMIIKKKLENIFR